MPHVAVYALLVYLSCNTQHMAAKSGPCQPEPARNTTHMADPITIRQVSAAVSRQLANENVEAPKLRPDPSILWR
jgi:hypothetical protein